MFESGPDRRIICRYNDVFLTARVFGKGEKNIVAFHGYGQNGDVFKLPVENEAEFTVYSFDLFYHGLSDSPLVNRGLTHQTLKKLFENFISQTGIQKCVLLGFSMGGKYVLSIFSNFPELVERLVLVAPDGIKRDFWYSLATRNTVFRKLFKMMVKQPDFFFKIAFVLDRLKLVDGRVRKFALNEMSTYNKRIRVYNSWQYLKNLFVQREELVKLINQTRIPVIFVLGKYDRIISATAIEKFSNRLNKSEVVYLKSGHTHLLNNFVERMKEFVN